MTQLDLENIKIIARKYHNFQCIPCSLEILNYLLKVGLKAKLIRISTETDQPPFSIIVHPIGSDRIISSNGFHQGVVISSTINLEIIETVFDNLHPDGIIKADWISSFNGPLIDYQGKFTIIEIEPSSEFLFNNGKNHGSAIIDTQEN